MTDAQVTKTAVTMLEPAKITGTKRPLTDRQKHALRRLLERGIDDHFHGHGAPDYNWKAPVRDRIRVLVRNAPEYALRLRSIAFSEYGSITVQIWVGNDANVWTWSTWTGSIGPRGGLSTYESRRRPDGTRSHPKVSGWRAATAGWSSI